MIAVLVPTVNRADVLEGVLANIAEATTVPHRAYVIAEYSDKDTVKVLRRLKGEHLSVFGDFGSAAKAMNAGYWASDEDFVFTSNDDVRLHEGWAEAALDVMGDDTHIVGTNDGNGRMTCFALARRSFIEQHSGVFDRRNVLWHEYISQYPDTELADFAKHRGVWGEAPDSVTEHLHWEFGKADRNHPNYRKAADTVGRDHGTYTERRRLWETASVSPAEQVSSART